jgi:hypothetical protein
MSKICDELTRILRHAPGDLDKEYILVCGQIATAFFMSVEKKVRIRVQIRVDTASSPIIQDVHPKWLVFVDALSERPTGKAWIYSFKKIVGANPLAIVTVGTIAGKDIEVWIGDLTALVKTCSVCKKEYSTTVNAQRCIQGHSKGARHIADKAVIISRTWDGLSTDERVSLFSEYRDMAQNYQGPLLDVVMNPGKVSAKELCDALEETSDGTFWVPYGDHPVSDLLLFEDQIALLAYRIETTLVAHANARELTGDQKSAKSVKRFLKKFKADIPENRFLRMVWMARAKGLNYDSEKYLQDRNRERKIQPVERPFDHAAALRFFAERMQT